MARPVKTGLDYFPKDTGFYRDRKIRALIGRFGADGAALYDYILCEVYSDKGYYTIADESFIDIAAADLCMSPEKIGLILNYLLNKSMLLDGTLFKTVKVITSHGIQTRYQEAVRQRAAKKGICVDGELWLLNEAETESFIKVRNSENYSRNNHDKSEKNHSFSKQESVKERKEKEKKLNEMKEDNDAPSVCHSPAISFFLENVNQTESQTTLDLLSDFERDLGSEVCIRAMMVAIENKGGKADWGYIHGILKNKKRDGIRSLAAWDAAEAEFKKRHGWVVKTVDRKTIDPSDEILKYL